MDQDRPNECKDRGIWSQCQVGFKRWLDQEHCRFAVKSENRDQCMHVGEIGNCTSRDAQKDAREK